MLIIIIIGNLWRPISWEPRALTKADKHIHFNTHTHTHKLHATAHTTHMHARTHTHAHRKNKQVWLTKELSHPSKEDHWIFLLYASLLQVIYGVMFSAFCTPLSSQWLMGNVLSFLYASLLQVIDGVMSSDFCTPLSSQWLMGNVLSFLYTSFLPVING